MRYGVYKTLRFIVKPFFYLLCNPKYIGLDNIPQSGPVILAGNHTHNYDAFLMLGGPKRIVHMMAKKELFSNKLTTAFFTSMACISVDRSIHDEVAKSKAVEVLKEGKVLGIFPEGTVNKTDDIILPFKFGAVSFAKKTNAKIVPFAITGSYFKRNIKIVYGQAYNTTGDLEKDNKILEEKVINLLKESK